MTEQLTKETSVKHISFDSDNFAIEDDIIKLKTKTIITDPAIINSGKLQLKSDNLKFKTLEPSTFLEMSSIDFFYIKFTRDHTFNSSDTDTSTPVFTGTTLNDITVSGTFSGLAPISYRVEIDGVQTSSITAFAVISTSTITVFANSGINPGIATTVTSTSHGLINGNIITITGTTSYNGTFTIQDITANTFDIIKIFVANDATGTWTKDPTKTLVTSNSHGLINGQVVTIAGTTSYNGNFTIEQTLINSFVIVDTFVANDATGTWTAANTFKWSDTGGTVFNASAIAITGANQVLNNGIIVNFVNIIGHSLVNVAGSSFIGVGLNDVTSGGTFSDISVITYRVEIETLGTPDTFRWSKDNGLTFVASGVPITGSIQNLDNGVTISFAATTGHSLKSIGTAIHSFGVGLNDLTSGGSFTGNKIVNYLIEVDSASISASSGLINTFKWSDDGGSTFQATNVPMSGSFQVLNNGVTITFAATGGHSLADQWTFTAAPNDTWTIAARPNDRWDFTAAPLTSSHILKTTNFCYNNKNLPLTLSIANGTHDINSTTEILTKNTITSKDINIAFVTANVS